MKSLLPTISIWAIPGLFFYIFVFSILELVDNLVDKILALNRRSLVSEAT